MKQIHNLLLKMRFNWIAVVNVALALFLFPLSGANGLRLQSNAAPKLTPQQANINASASTTTITTSVLEEELIPVQPGTIPPSAWEVLVSVKTIKTPQLIGIIAGCSVFFITISVVLYLLVQSGSLSRFRDEMIAGGPLAASGGNTGSKLRVNTAPQFSSMPELYDHLLDAASTLPLQPRMMEMKGLKCTVRPLNSASSDIAGLLAVSNGAAIFGESAYDPARIWGWMGAKSRETSSSSSSSSSSAGSSNGNGKNKVKGDQAYWPCASEQIFGSYFGQKPDSQHLIVLDNRLQQPVGMVSLVDNRPNDLNIRIDNLWITPAYQTKQYAHEAMYLLLKSLFEASYRRVTVYVDARHIIMRKFLERCGFILEAVLRKFRIVDRRNSDVAVYVILNSEWVEVDIRLKKLLGLPLKPVMHKVAEIDKAKEAVPVASRGQGAGGAAVSGVSSGNESSGASKKKKNPKNKLE